jgi:UDPglucose 6-dehydrogenase
MKISIFWTGYVWLVTGTCLAEVGHEVLCIDIDPVKIDNLKQGIVPIYEPWLAELVVRNYKEKRLDFSTDAEAGIAFADVVFSAVGTPPDANHKADLQYVQAVAQTFGQYVDRYKVFVNKSTVPVWTGSMCQKIIADAIKARGVAVDFDVVSNPEFLKEWVAVRDFMNPDRIVCGVSSDKAKSIMEKIYKPFTRSERPLFFTDVKSSEIIKYAANAFLATKISFINEIANFAEKVGWNISDISKWVGLDDRIGSRFLHAGMGYGGSCFSKDVDALMETGKEHDHVFSIIQATAQVNNKQKELAVHKLMRHIPDLTGKTVALRWLAFKPKTDDIRDAASLTVIDKLLSLWLDQIRVFDPVAMDNIQRMYGDRLIYCDTNYDAIQDADALVVITEWDEFRVADFEKINWSMRGNVIVDGRNIWNKEEIIAAGFVYEGIGR